MTTKRANIAATVLSAPAVAALLEHSTPWFYKHRAKLEKDRFPKRDALLGGWHRAAVEQWLARRAGVRPPSTSEGPSGLQRAIDARKNALRHAAG